MNKNLADEYLRACKKNYFEGITPSNERARSSPEYRIIVRIASEFFENNEYNMFAEFFQEEKYLISLWTAHMLLEYGNPSDELVISSLKIIESYLDNPLAPEISNEEKKWLDTNGHLYSDKF